MNYYLNSDGYAPSANTLSAKIKNIIEQQFPRLHQDIINDAIDYGTEEYRQYSYNNIIDYIRVSDEEAEEFFLNSVMKFILIHNRRQFKILTEFMLAYQRHHTQAPVTVDSELSSGFLGLNSHQQQKIFEENRKGFIPQEFRIQKTKVETKAARAAREEREERDARIIRARHVASQKAEAEARKVQDALLYEARKAPGKRTSARANQRSIAAAMGSTVPVPVHVQPSENAIQRARKEQKP